MFGWVRVVVWAKAFAYARIMMLDFSGLNKPLRGGNVSHIHLFAAVPVRAPNSALSRAPDT